jgi:carbon-monoxide dehydrogenase medium subunit
LKLRFAQPAHLVDIGRIGGLDYIKEDGGVLRIGALARESALEASEVVRSRYPILADTAAVIADPIVRNLATVCGNLAHGDPANDHPATMLALGAEVVATGPKGARTIPIAQFFTGLFTTALAPNEVLTEIRIPAPPPGSGGAYLKLERKVGDFATAGAAAFLVLKGDVIQSAGIGLTNVGPTPIKAREAEGHLAGKKADESAFAEAGRIAASATKPGADRRGSVEYKKEMARVLTVRALRKAAARAAGR